MDTLTEVQDVEFVTVNGRKAGVVTFFDGSKAGTFEKEVALAAKDAIGKGVHVTLGQQDGKTILEKIEVVIPQNPLDEIEPEPPSVVDNADQGGEVTASQPQLDVDADGDPVGDEAEIIASIYHTVTELQAENKELRDLLSLVLEKMDLLKAAMIERGKTPLKTDTAKPRTRKPAAKPKAPAKKPAAAKKPATRKPRTAAKKS